MKEWFPYGEFKKIGFFTKEMKGDYEAQADKVCTFLGLNSIYEYRSKEIRCHLTYDERPLSIDDRGKLKEAPFVETIKSIYE